MKNTKLCQAATESCTVWRKQEKNLASLKKKIAISSFIKILLFLSTIHVLKLSSFMLAWDSSTILSMSINTWLLSDTNNW